MARIKVKQRSKVKVSFGHCPLGCCSWLAINKKRMIPIFFCCRSVSAYPSETIFISIEIAPRVVVARYTSKQKAWSTIIHCKSSLCAHDLTLK